MTFLPSILTVDARQVSRGGVRITHKNSQPTSQCGKDDLFQVWTRNHQFQDEVSLMRNVLRRGMAAVLLFLLAHAGFAADEFPGRKKYYDVPIYQLKQLYENRDRVVIVDARSPFEFSTLSIKGAINIPYTDSDFIERVRKLRTNSNRPIVFYCNGRTCFKSYKAARKAMHRGISDVYAYDAGVFEWAQAYPAEAVLLGETPIDPSHIISGADFKKRLLTPLEFTRRIEKLAARDKSMVIDVRDLRQRAAVGLFPRHEYWAALEEMNKLLSLVRKARREGKTLFIYDAVGKQVRWVQYRLQREGVNNYYFMKGGARAYYKDIIIGRED
ncbi:MAG TPA: rhodanese-like domain-containing protein [Gammaproteobacteria bacterium]|nr:rhodanese-like domain-containing protein [Gammaproteobacteria bacterium]